MSTKPNKIFFAHANGVPAKSYQKFFSYLDGFETSFIPVIGKGDFPIDLNWKSSVNELIHFIENNYDEPVIGIGHSFGGVITIFASSIRPDLFLQTIVIDPPLFGRKKRSVIGALRLVGKEGTVFKLPAMAKNRRNDFETKEDAFNYFKGRGIFKNFDEESLLLYIEHGLEKKKSGEGFQLSISPKMESEIFRLMPCFVPKRLLSPKNCTFLYAKEKGLHDEGDKKWHKSALKNTKFLGLEGGHMMPMERPEQMAKIIKDLIV